ncbi:MAG TPA: hypothetical protein VGI31_01750 [Streptosporangiaceae bacterium]
MVGATADAFTTIVPGVVTAAHSGFDADGRPVFDLSQPGDWVAAWPEGQMVAGLGPDLLAILRDGTLAAHLPDLEISEDEPAVSPAGAVMWSPPSLLGGISGRSGGRAGSVAPAVRGVREVPPGAVLVAGRFHGYLAWSGPVEEFGRQARDGGLIGAGNTHLEVSAVKPGVPQGTYLFEFTIGGGVALALPRDHRRWLPAGELSQATVLGVWRGTMTGQQREMVLGVQGRSLGDLVDGRPVVRPRIPDGARVIPVDPEIRSDTGQSLRSLLLRAATSLGGAELGPAEPIRWWVRDADGLPGLDGNGNVYQRDIGLSFKSPEEREESSWGSVTFDSQYALGTQQPGGSTAWETRPLPFQFSERTFFVDVHSNPYLMVGPATGGGLAQRLTGGYQGFRAVSAARLARTVLDNDAYQAALQEHGDDLEVVLFACTGVTHAQEFAAGLGRPVWSANGVAVVGRTTVGHRIGLRMRAGEFEPGWYLVPPDGAIGQVTLASPATPESPLQPVLTPGAPREVPLGGQQTRSGFYFPDAQSTPADVRASELAAARSFPPVSGAAVLHVHFGDGAFAVGGQMLTPSQFLSEVVDELGLPPGQPLILVACQTAAVAATGPRRAASVLASLSGRAVIAATGEVFTTPNAQVVTTHSGVDANGYPVVNTGPAANWVIAWPDGTLTPRLGPNLLATLNGEALAAHLPGMAITPTGPATLLAGAVKWSPPGLLGGSSGRSGGRSGSVAPSARGVRGVPPGAVPVPGQIRGYLAWTGSLEDFGRQARDGTLIGAGNTHLELSAAEPATVPQGAYLIEFTIGGGAALARPGSSRRWLPVSRLNQAMVLGVHRGTMTGRQRELALGVQGRRLGDLADGRPVAWPRLPRGARVIPVDPEIRTDTGQSVRAALLRAATSLGGAGLGPSEPIRWWVKDEELYLPDADGRNYQRDIGLSFKSPKERQESPWGSVTFDSNYALGKKNRDGSTDWETRPLPFQFSERTFFVDAHSNPYLMVGPAVGGGLVQRLTGDYQAFRAVSGAGLARAVLENEVYQRALQEHGDDLEVVLFACTGTPHAQEFAAALGRPSGRPTARPSWGGPESATRSD